MQAEYAIAQCGCMSPQVPFQQWDTQQTTVCVILEGAQVLDIWGTPFPNAENCTTVDHRCVTLQRPIAEEGGARIVERVTILADGLSKPIVMCHRQRTAAWSPARFLVHPSACRPRGVLLSSTLPYSGGVGLTTGDQLVSLVAAFTEPVTGLTAASFALAGPPSGATVSALQLVRCQIVCGWCRLLAACQMPSTSCGYAQRSREVQVLAALHCASSAGRCCDAGAIDDVVLSGRRQPAGDVLWQCDGVADGAAFCSVTIQAACQNACRSAGVGCQGGNAESGIFLSHAHLPAFPAVPGAVPIHWRE